MELKLRNVNPHKENSVVFIVANACTSRDYTNNSVGVCFVGQDVTSEKVYTDKFIRLQGDYKAIIQSINPLIPPIFACDENASCSEWNTAMVKLTGWSKQETIGKLIPGEIFGEFCRLQDPNTLTKFMIILYKAIGGGEDTEKFPFAFSDRKGKYVKVVLTANKRTDGGGNVIGCFCFLHTFGDNDYPLEGERKEERKYSSKLKELAYIRQEIINPLNGIRFTHKLLENTPISDYQKQFLDTSDACERQIMTVIEDMDLGSIEEG